MGELFLLEKYPYPFLMKPTHTCPTPTSQPVHFSLTFQLRADLKLSNSCYCSGLLPFHRANRCSIMAQKP